MSAQPVAKADRSHKGCSGSAFRSAYDDMNHRYLYRGVNEELHRSSGGLLRPKLINRPFTYVFKADASIRADGAATAGPSEKNAVYGHQVSSERFPTSGISTTPVFRRAQYYATEGGKYALGYIFKLDRKLLGGVGVKEYIVSEWVENPSEPEDEEVILVAQDLGAPPLDVVVEIIEVRAEPSGAPDRQETAPVSR